MVKNLPAVRKTQVWSLGWEDPLEKEWQPTNGNPVFLPGESHGQRGPVGYSPRGRTESDRPERVPLHFDIFTVSVQFVCTCACLPVCCTHAQVHMCAQFFLLSVDGPESLSP